MEKETLWTKEFLIVSVINFLATLVFYLLIVAIAPYAMLQFNASTSTAGFVSGILVIGSLFGRLGAGRFIGNIGATKTLWIGLVLFAITTLLYLVTFSLEFLIINRFIQGSGIGIIATATGTIVAHLLPKSRKGEGIGYFSLSVVLSTAIGPFVGIMLMEMENGYHVIFTVTSLIAAICIIIFAFVKLNLPISKKMQIDDENRSFIWKYFERKTLPIASIALLIGFGYSGIMSYISFYAYEINLVNAASYFYLIYAAVVMLSRPITGKLLDVKGANVIIYPCLIVLALGMLLFSQSFAGWMLLLSAALIGFGHGNFSSIAQTIAVKVTEPQYFGLATATFFTFVNIGLGFGPYILGFFIPLLGYRTIFASMAILFAMCIPLYHFLHGKRDKELLGIS